MDLYFSIDQEYLIQKLGAQHKQIEKDQSDIRQYRQESEGIIKKIKEIETG